MPSYMICHLHDVMQLTDILPKLLVWRQKRQRVFERSIPEENIGKMPFRH